MVRKRRARGARDVVQRGGPLAVDGDPLGVSRARHAGAPRVVRRQVADAGDPVEAGPPEGELRGELLAFQPVAVPGREVAVGAGKGRQRARSRVPAGPPGVERRHLVVQDVERPAVPDDVVRHEEEDVLGRAEPEDVRLEEGRLREIEGLRGELLEPFGQAPVARLAGEPGEVLGGKEGDAHVLVDALDCRRAARLEARPQHGLAAHHLAEGAFEGALVQLAHEPVRRRRVVGHAAGVELLEEPEPLLGE